MTKPAEIFISYNHGDREFVQRLAEKLTGRGGSVWFDQSMAGGDTISSEVQDRISQAKACLVLWSHNSINSSWVIKEHRMAIEAGNYIPMTLQDDVIHMMTNKDTFAASLDYVQISAENDRDISRAVTKKGANLHAPIDGSSPKIEAPIYDPQDISKLSAMTSEEILEMADASAKAIIGRIKNEGAKGTDKEIWENLYAFIFARRWDKADQFLTDIKTEAVFFGLNAHLKSGRDFDYDGAAEKFVELFYSRLASYALYLLKRYADDMYFVFDVTGGFNSIGDRNPSLQDKFQKILDYV